MTTHTEVYQLLTEQVGEARLRLIQQRCKVVLQSPSSSTLIVNKIDITVLEHDVPRLEITIEEIVLVRFQQTFDQRVEVVFEVQLVERDVGEFQEVVFEIVQVPLDGLPVEGRGGGADGKVEVFLSTKLDKRKLLKCFLEIVNDIVGNGARLGLAAGEVGEQGFVAEVVLHVVHPVIADG